jgi:hypothetical protein
MVIIDVAPKVLGVFEGRSTITRETALARV